MKDGCIDLDEMLSEIADLKKENAELRAKESFVGDQNRKLCEQQQKIEVLEKENAELKKQLEMSNKVYNDNLDYSHHIEGQLTNAKEIIREFMKYEINEYDGSLEIHFEELKKQAEQFLNSEGKE